MAIEVKVLDDGLAFGARISGVTSSLLKDEDVRTELRRVFEDRGVIVFEGIEPSAAMQVEVSTIFGPLKDHPVHTVEDARPCIRTGRAGRRHRL